MDLRICGPKKGGVEVDGRRLLYEANQEQWPPDRLFQMMARHVPKLYAPYLLTKTAKKRPLLAPGPSPESKRMILFTEPQLSKNLRVNQLVSLMKGHTMDLLRKAFRSGYDGWVINPGDSSRRVFNREELLHLFREYVAVEGRRLGGAWVPTRGDRMLLIQLEDGSYTVTAYIDERAAREVCDDCGGEPVLHSWDVIGERCLRAGGKVPYIQFGFPEQVLLLPRHMDWLRRKEEEQKEEEGETSLEATESEEFAETEESKEFLCRLEQAVRNGQGWVNTREIVRRMAELDRIWILVGPGGKPVYFGSEGKALMVDLFTSRDHALRLIQALKQQETLDGIEPLLVEARPLFQHLSAQEPVIWINRGSPEGWTSITNQLLPAVLNEEVSGSGKSSRVKL